MVAICIGGGLVSVYQRAVGPLRFVGFIKMGRRGGWARVNVYTESLFSPRFSTIVPYYRSFQNLSSLVLDSSGAALQDVINQKKPRYLSSHCPTAPGYQSLLEELSMLLPLQHKFQGLMLYAFLDLYFSSRTPVGDTRVSCFQVK